jgi:hypothetical protein
MFEMRWVALGKQRHLQFRYVQLTVDASGALCLGGWVSWQDVPTIDVNDAAIEDVIASGGIAGSP